MIYRIVSVKKGNKLIDWADYEGIGWHILNLAELFCGDTDKMELGLEYWPE